MCVHTHLFGADGLGEDAVLVLLLQLTQHGSQQHIEGRQLQLQHRLLLLHLPHKHTVTIGTSQRCGVSGRDLLPPLSSASPSS